MCWWLSAKLYLRTVTTSKGVPGGAPVENGGGKPRSNLALTAASRLPFTAAVDGTSNRSEVMVRTIRPSRQRWMRWLVRSLEFQHRLPPGIHRLS